MVSAPDIETITVDSYTTLVDVDAQVDVLAEQVPALDDPRAVSRTWRCQAMQYTMIANDIDAYRPFSALLDQSLDYALRHAGHEVDPRTRRAIRRTVYEDRLAVFPDVAPGLERLTGAGYPVYILSNGDPPLLAELMAAADLEGIVEAAISADEIERYKPESAIYRHAAARTETPIDRVLHVSGGTMRDVWGAAHAGMQTAWLRRPGKPAPMESLGAAPDLTVADFLELGEHLAG